CDAGQRGRRTPASSRLRTALASAWTFLPVTITSRTRYPMTWVRPRLPACVGSPGWRPPWGWLRKELTLSSTVAAILQGAASEGRRLSYDQGVALLRSADLLSLGRAADLVCKRLHPEPFRTYNIDRNINYTNVCAAVCDFCAFYRKVGDTEAYVLDRD